MIKGYQTLIVITIVFLFSFSVALAQEPPSLAESQQLAELTSGSPEIWIGQYIAGIYRYGVALAAFLAVVMIMGGGLIWLTSAGRRDQVGTAKDFISSALLGLLLALFSFVLLYTINPRLTVFQPLNIAPINFSNTNATADIDIDIETLVFCCNKNGSDFHTANLLDGCASPNYYQCSPGQVCGDNPNGAGLICVADESTEAKLREKYKKAGIDTKPPCPEGRCEGCVNLAGLPNSTFVDLKRLKEASGSASLFITGGTEEDCHDSHRPGRSIVDLRKDKDYQALTDYIKQNGERCNPGFGNAGYIIGDNDLYVDEGDHWHVEFNSTRPCIKL